MGVLEKIGGLLGGGVGGKIVDAINARMENKQHAADLAHEITMILGARSHEVEMASLQTARELAAGQVEINKIEAASDSLLKSGWRPMVGWVCVAALAYALIVRPFVVWGSAIAGWPAPPEVSVVEVMALLTPLLGLGAMRTYEKTQ